jgi:hypothetical protein
MLSVLDVFIRQMHGDRAEEVLSQHRLNHIRGSLFSGTAIGSVPRVGAGSA